MENGKLIVLGSINVDHILMVPHFPRPGETIAGSRYQISFGGKGANQAVAAARSGANTLLMGSVGEDNLAGTILFKLAEDKVGIQLIEIQKNMVTGVAMIFVNEKGENCIGINAGANAIVSADYVNRHQDYIKSAGMLLTQLEIPVDAVLTAVKIAKEANVPVILNPAPAKDLPNELISLVDIITPNEIEAEMLTGISVKDDKTAQQAADILHDKGINIVIITLGDRGAWLSINKQGKLIEGYQVEAIDTTAAGDTFNGALATALLEKQSLESAVKFAHAAAAIAVTRLAAAPSIPTREEIERFITDKRKQDS